MACESCGEKPKNTAKGFTKAVIEINNPETLVLLRKVVIPASMGDEESVPPAVGKYRNVLLQYEANGHIYLYSSDGIPTAITANIPQEVLDSIAELEEDVVDLQEQIDDLKNSPDVVDIVPTYAALQTYDTSKLGDNDIVRVLQDEQHDGQSTYYRWNKQSSTWTYIGAVGDYYTKSQVDSLLDDKQDVLTAGANITIDANNVISATDTTYSDFVGTDGTAVGTAGLVPAPAIADVDKFLKSDGTWGEVGGGDVVYSDKTTSNSDTGGAVYIGNKNASQQVLGDPTTTDNHYKYFWALPYANGDAPTRYSVNILGRVWNTFGNAVAIGVGAYALGGGSSYDAAQTAIGPSAKAQGNHNVALGSNASCENNYSAAIGSFARTTRVGEVNVGTGIDNYGYNSTNYRVIGGVHDPIDSHDASTKGYVDNIVVNYAGLYNAGAPTTSTVAYYLGQFYYDTTNDDIYYCSNIDTTDPNNPVYTWTALPSGGGGPTVVQTAGTSTTDVMSQNATTEMIYADPGTRSRIRIGSADSQVGDLAVAIGLSSYARGESSVSIGQGSTNYAAGLYCVTIGNAAKTNGNPRSVALGNGTVVGHENSVALGSNATTTRIGEVNVGAGTSGRGYNNTNYRVVGGVHDPVDTHDAATKGYVDTVAPVITMTDTDPGEGAPLDENHYIGVYDEPPIILDYATVEINTGTRWITGDIIYKRTVSLGALPNATTATVAHNISNFDTLVKLEGVFTNGTDSGPIPYASPTATKSIQAYVNATNITIVTGEDRSGFTGYATIYYTKTTNPV